MKVAIALFSCPAKSRYGPAWAACNNHVAVDLFNDGQYDNFNRPDGWHIELGFDPDQTIVRCPSHCKWVPDEPIATSGFRGHWEDAPLPDPYTPTRTAT